MATFAPRTFIRHPALASAAILSAAGTAYYLSRPNFALDSAQNAPNKTLSLPKNMLFSQLLKVTSVEQINHDTKKITFELPGGKSEVSGVSPGGAILTQHTPEGAWFPVLRPYTPIHDLDERGTLQLLVKKYPNGKASSYIHSLQPGESLKVRGPLPGAGYKASPDKSHSILLVAGGAGITPIYSLTKGILADEEDNTRIQLVWGVNGTRDIILKEQLEELKRKFPDRLDVTYCVSGPEGKADAPSLAAGASGEEYRKGYVNESVIKEVVSKIQGAGKTWGDAKGTKVFLCGPPTMEDAVAGKQGVLAALGVTKKEVYKF
ncbi:cytochrome-b5 reductase [Polychaeton citri CBS 116435]|uniref:NADH-cytochrome b5 reductase 2 n=1 Tax=Polychaeton citri CBS 116435 TaxID=1314669 RepID=A0A9P4Q8J9_9PEZI|nr:cytochrome-b5 reductase [Polychaeton citri CBS 116435]